MASDSSAPPVFLSKTGVLRHLPCFPPDSWIFVPSAGCCGNPQFPLWLGLALRLLRSIVEQLSSNHLLFLCSCCLSEVGIPFQWCCPSWKRSCHSWSHQLGGCRLLPCVLLVRLFSDTWWNWWSWGCGCSPAISVVHTLLVLLVA